MLATISREQIDSVRTNNFLAPTVATSLSNPSTARKPAASLSDSEWDDLHDACIDALMNEAPVVECFDAEQDNGVYTVSIRGVPGAYYVSAPEFDDSEIFSTLEDARWHAESAHGEFRIGKDSGKDNSA